MVKIFAERQNWKIYPKKHTNRIACATTLFKLGLDETSIDLHMGWLSDFMQKYYIMDFVNTKKNGPAHLLKKAVESGKLFRIQDHMLTPAISNKYPY